jgi:hypothetical protein
MQQASRRLTSYAIVALTSVAVSAVGSLAGLGRPARYALAAVVLCASVGGLLTWSERLRIRSRSIALAVPSGASLAESVAGVVVGGGWLVTPGQLGLAGAALSTGASADEADRRPIVWLPAADALRRVSLHAEEPDLRVAAHAPAGGPTVAGVCFPAFGVVYVLLPSGDGGRHGEVLVPGLAFELVEQRVSVEWFADVDALPREEAVAIASSARWGGFAVRRAWREAVALLPAEHPLRIAVGAALGPHE